MNISDSALFKDFARPVLESEAQKSTVYRLFLAAMDLPIYSLLGSVRLEARVVEISSIKKDSFDITLEWTISRTSPFNTAIDLPIISMCFNGTKFGSLNIPQIKSPSLWGHNKMLQKDTVTIVDMTTFQALLRSIVTLDDTSLELEAYPRSVSSTAPWTKDVQFPGMKGTKIRVRRITPSDSHERIDRDEINITATLQIVNDSPLRVEPVESHFRLLNNESETMALLWGQFTLREGTFEVDLKGLEYTKVKPSHRPRLVGLGVDGDSCVTEVIQQIDVVVSMDTEFSKGNTYDVTVGLENLAL